MTRIRRRLGVTFVSLSLALALSPTSVLADDTGSPSPAGDDGALMQSYESDSTEGSVVDPNGATTDGGSWQTPDGVEGEAAVDDNPPAAPSPQYEWRTAESAPAAGRLAYSAAPTDEGIPFAGWRACGAFDSRYQVVKDYSRVDLDSRMERDYARLYCGIRDADEDDGRFGYRHIKGRHLNDWANKAAYINKNWRDLAGWAMKYTMADPDAAWKTSRSFCYHRKFLLYYGNQQVGKMRVVMYLGLTGVRIFTAIPTTSGGCNTAGTRILR